MKLPPVKKYMWWLLAIIFAAALILTVCLLLPYDNKQQTTVSPIGFSGTYRLGSSTETRPLTEQTYIDACEENSVLLRGSFSQEMKKDTHLLFFMEYLKLHIWLNGEEIYSWGTEKNRPSFMSSAGAAWGHCVLPATVSSQDEVTILLESQYTNNYNSAYHDFLNSLQVGDSGALARKVLAENWPYLLTGLLLFLAGLTLQLFVLLLVRQGVAIHSSIYFCAFFILFTSLWTALNPVYSTLAFGNAALIMLLETITMWLFSACMFGYFGTFMQTKARLYNNYLLFGFLFSLVIFLILQLFGVTDAYAVRDAHNAILGLASIIFFFIFYYEIRLVKKSQLLTLALPGIMYVIFGAIEILNYQFEWLPRGAALTVGFVIFVIAQFILAVRQIRNSLLMSMKAISLEKDLVESRTAVMLSQIQPHFLYNALTGIKTLCGSDPSRAEEAMEHFSFFLRRNLDCLSYNHLISFDKEISHVKDYFYLEEMRFNSRVQLVLELEVHNFLLPPLTLQPLVENAVRYGITKKNDGGTVTVKSQKQNGNIMILIIDDGVGFDVNSTKKEGRSHTGINNVRSRLHIQCGGSLEITSNTGVGTKVCITLPERMYSNENYDS